MTYFSGEGAVYNAIVNNLGAFSASNTSRGNWQILNQGQSDVYAIIRPGPWENAQVTITTHHRTYTTVTEVWVRYKNDSATTTLVQNVESVADELIKHVTLGLSGVIRFTVTRASDVEVITLKDNSVWLKQEIVSQWTEETSVTYE